MGAQPYTDDAEPAMYCFNCATLVDTNNHAEWTTMECAECGDTALIHPYEAEADGLLPL